MTHRDTVLDLSDVGKLYQLGKIGSGTLSGDLGRTWQRLRGNGDPLVPVDLNASRGMGTEHWALQHVNLQVQRGEVLGLIGKNGAGKSTLLKLLSRVTTPTTGRIRMKGRLASLLEVGTGMHPELSGRENVFLNGAILGMSRSEIAAKFDQIVDFSGCEKYIDTPVKRYSSGMKVRLGFSVAAFLEPEMLIVDEVLAVGDAEFQKKAIARMQELSSGGERTVIFVSHSMSAVSSLCTRAVLLRDGEVAYDGDVQTCIAHYLGYHAEASTRHREWADSGAAPAGEGVRMSSAALHAAGKDLDSALDTGDALRLEVEVECAAASTPLDCTLQVYSENGTFIATSSSIFLTPSPQAGASRRLKFSCEIPAHFFNQGVYRFGILVLADRRRTVLRLDDVFRIPFAAAPRHAEVWMGTPGSLLLPHWEWKVEGAG